MPDTTSVYDVPTKSMQGDPEARRTVAGASASCSGPMTARCANRLDLDWIPVREQSVIPPAIHSLCQTCPGRLSCLRRAVDTSAHGYWAGTNRVDRERLQRAGSVTLEAADDLQRAARDGQRHREQERANDRLDAAPLATHRLGEGSLHRYKLGCHCGECRAHNTMARATERARARATAAA